MTVKTKKRAAPASNDDAGTKRYKDRNKVTFTGMGLWKKAPPAKGYIQLWEKGKANGLSMMISAAGAKTFRSNFYINNKPQSRKLWRLGEKVTDADLITAYTSADHEQNEKLKAEFARLTDQQKFLEKLEMEIAQARAIALNDRAKAGRGVDPRLDKDDKVGKPVTFAEARELYIRECKVTQRSWAQTERALTLHFEDLENRDVRTITRADIYKVTDKLLETDRIYAAEKRVTYVRSMWRFLQRREIVASGVMDELEINIEKRERTTTFGDAEIKKIWNAAGRFDDPTIKGYIRLLILLAPRKSALAGMRPEDIIVREVSRALTPDATEEEKKPIKLSVWRTPYELTKSKKRSKTKREYHTPLTAPALQIINEVMQHHGNDKLIFPGRFSDTPLWPGTKLTKQLIRYGAPETFNFHAMRHSISTWLQDQGHSDFEAKLVLNHSTVTGATSFYSHGHALLLKLSLLQKWSDHVEALITDKPKTAKKKSAKRKASA